MTDASIPCSVQILTHNSADSLVRCLDGLTAFREVMLIDGNSTDGTLEIAKRYPNVVVIPQDPAYLSPEGRITDFAAMRNTGLQKAAYEWILQIDSDEIVEETLVHEVREIVEKNTPGAYRVFRRFIVDGEKVMHCAGYPAYHIRFFHRSCVDGYIKAVHERPAVRAGIAVQTLVAELGVPLPPARELTEKYDRYLDLEVKRLGVMSWGHWFRWVLLRNLRSAIGITVLSLRVKLLPLPGKKMPFIYDWQAITHSLRTIIATFPPLARRRLQ